MKAFHWIVLALALIQAGWFMFDGGRALVAGDYVTPTSGPHAGQLGPWSRIVSALGFEPRSTFIKCLHLALGFAWFSGTIVFVVRPGLGWWFLLGCAVASLWYLPIGTILSIVVIALLLAPQNRNLL